MIYTHRDISRVCPPAPGPVHRSETRVAVRGAGFRRVDGELLNGEKRGFHRSQPGNINGGTQKMDGL